MSKRPSSSLDSWIATHKAMSHMKSKLDLNSYFFKLDFLISYCQEQKRGSHKPSLKRFRRGIKAKASMITLIRAQHCKIS